MVQRGYERCAISQRGKTLLWKFRFTHRFAGAESDDGERLKLLLELITTDFQKTESRERIPARRILEVCGDDLNLEIREALQSVIKRDEMGPNIGQVPPEINLKLMGTEDRVRLSSFQGKRPVALVFGSYT